MFAQVVPSVRLPKNFGAFDYIIPDKYHEFINPGSWVVVPWRKKIIDGLVISLTNSPVAAIQKLKEIYGFGDEQPIGEDLLGVIPMASNYYLTSSASIIKTFLPSTPKTRIITNPTLKNNCPEKNFKVEPKREVINYQSFLEKGFLIKKAVSEAITNSGSIIITTPHSEEIYSVAKIVTEISNEVPIILFHGGLSGAILRKTWKQILNTPQSIVIGTRLASFAPIKNLRSFLILEADSADLRQYDQNPRYDARDIVRWRADLAQASCVFLSHAPRLEEFVLTKKSNFILKTQKNSRAATIVDISANPQMTDSVLAPTIIDRIEETLQKNKKVFVIHNHLGTAGALICRDCKHVFRCPNCQIAFTVHEFILSCNRCKLKNDLPLNCSHCFGINLRRVGVGLDTIVPKLKKRFFTANVCSYNSTQSTEERKKILTQADIVVGTKLLIHDVAENGPDDCYGCIVMTSVDELFIHPGFKTNEEAWRTIYTLKNVAQTSNAELLLQTIDPENQKLKMLSQNMEDFMSEELNHRQTTGFPPVGELITVTVKASTLESAMIQVTKLKPKIELLLNNCKAVIAGPLPHSHPYRDASWRSLLAIKTTTIPPQLTDFLTSLSEMYIIDRNPEKIG